MKSTISSRSVINVTNSIQTYEGAGFLVNRPFPNSNLSQIDPFLLLDEMGPMELAPGQAQSAPDHPHRGFETVTYLLAGEMRHRDSQGHKGTLRPGDVQWMTAGQGVVHSEMPTPAFLKSGGRMHGFQLWVNLPKKSKMTLPQYQEISAQRLPVILKGQQRARIKIIAGPVFNQPAVIQTQTPILYWHVSLARSSNLHLPIPPDFNLFVYVFGGQGKFGLDLKPAHAGQLVRFAQNGDHITLHTSKTSTCEVLVIGGQPLNEPFARYGPFVMNTQAEIQQAFTDYRSGKLGNIK